MSPPLTRSNFGYQLLLLARRWRQLVDAELEAYQLSDATWRPLVHLSHLGDGVRQKDLASGLGIGGPALVRLLDALEEQGLIERDDDAEDRRAKRIRLTKAGRELSQRVRGVLSELESEFLGGLRDAQLEQCGRIFEQLDQGMQAVSARQSRNNP
ncbi:MarR family transcriptional regulator [Myxococcus sp. Y35]|uniref:MarR family transcriptional regulator n=1 Tax=Pseudomyxococcus flavus TaxID=3115648 RepID=UPI003CEE30FF